MKNILALSIVFAIVGAITGFILERRKKTYNPDEVEYVNGFDIDIPIDEETE